MVGRGDNSRQNKINIQFQFSRWRHLSLQMIYLRQTGLIYSQQLPKLTGLSSFSFSSLSNTAPFISTYVHMYLATNLSILLKPISLKGRRSKSSLSVSLPTVFLTNTISHLSYLTFFSATNTLANTSLSEPFLFYDHRLYH